MSKNYTALTAQNSGFLKLAEFGTNGVMTEELDGLEGGFEKIKIPSAGSTVLEVPGEDPGEPDAVKEFSAVILHHHPIHSYYREKYTGGNAPPDCGSFDGVAGEGNPGGACAKCPYNRFGSGENDSKACKNRRRIYVLREGEIFPLLLSLPTGSLQEFIRYIKRLLSKGKTSSSVVTLFSLKKAVNKGGITYSQAQFSVDRPLSPEEYALVKKISDDVKAFSQRVAIETDNVPDMPDFDHETGEVIEPL